MGRSLLPASAMRALVLFVFAAADADEIVEPLQGMLRVLALLNDIASTHCALTPFARLPLLADSSQLHISTVSSCPPKSYLSLDMLARYSHHYRLQPGSVEVRFHTPSCLVVSRRDKTIADRRRTARRAKRSGRRGSKCPSRSISISWTRSTPPSTSPRM